jgi:hypothetical protein
MGCGASNAAGGVAPAPAAQQQAPVQQAHAPAAAPAPAHQPAAPAPSAAAQAPAEEPAAAPVQAHEEGEAKVQGGLPNKKPLKPLSWAEIRAKLPWDQSEDQKAQRQTLFKQFDVNGSGQLSLAEVDKAIRDVLAIGEIFDAKPVIIRAFEQVKALDGSKGVAANGLNNADFVSFSEFRLLLQYLYHFFVLFEFFHDIADVDGDAGRLSVNEFKAAKPQLASMGVQIADPEAEFVKIVATPGSNHILFSEFAEWALKKNLQYAVQETH